MWDAFWGQLLVLAATVGVFMGTLRLEGPRRGPSSRTTRSGADTDPDSTRAEGGRRG